MFTLMSIVGILLLLIIMDFDRDKVKKASNPFYVLLIVLLLALIALINTTNLKDKITF